MCMILFIKIGFERIFDGLYFEESNYNDTDYVLSDSFED